MPKSSDPASTYSARKSSGRRALMVWLPRDVHQQLRMAAVNKETSMQSVVEAALRKFFGRAVSDEPLTEEGSRPPPTVEPPRQVVK